MVEFMQQPTYQIKSQAFASEINGSIVVMNLERGTYSTLNSTGSAIWRRLATPASAEELVQDLTQRFEIDEPSCKRSVDAFVEALIQRELIEPKPVQE